MPGYRLLLLDEYGDVSKGWDLTCNDDDHAIRTFARHVFKYGAELWQQARLVRAFEADTKIHFISNAARGNRASVPGP